MADKSRERLDVLKAQNKEYGKQINANKELISFQDQIVKGAQAIYSQEEGISSLSDRQLKNQIQKTDFAINELKVKSKSLKITKDSTAAEKALEAARKGGFAFEKETVEELKKELAFRKAIEKKMGVTGGILKGIAKIPILGNVLDANEALDAMKGTGGSVKEGFKNIGGQIKDSLLNPTNLALGALTLMASVLKGADKATGDLAKSMNLSYNEASGVRDELMAISNSSFDNAINTERLQETLSFVNKELGTSGKMSEDNLKTFTKLRRQAGMTNEEIMSMQKFSMVMGGDLESNVVNFQAQAKALSMSKGSAVNVKQLMADMSKVSNRTKMSIEGGAEGLAKAAVNAKLMGGNLDQVASIADSLLNFEQSIEKELSAELLLGKDINLEKARTAALNNDMATVAAEITKQAGTAAQFGDMNRIQQEAIAAAMGMSADQMADMLFEQEALKSIGTDLNDEQQKAFDLAKEKYGVEEASRILASDAAGEGIDGLVNQQAMAEEFADTVAQLKEVFVDIAQTVLPAISMAFKPISFVVGAIASGIGMFVDALKKGKGPAIVLAGILGAMALPLISSAIGAIMSTFALIPFGIGIPLGLAAIVGMFSQLGKAKQVGDLGINPNGGPIVMSPKEGGVFQGTKNDALEMSPTAGRGGGGANMTQTNALLQQLIDIISAGGNVTLDGQKVGEALNLVSYKVQ